MLQCAVSWDVGYKGNVRGEMNSSQQRVEEYLADLMTNVLKHKRDLRKANLSTKHIIVVVLELFVGEVVPAVNDDVSNRRFDEYTVRTC